MMQDMGGSSIGIWCAHGEGRAHFPDPQVKDNVLQNGLAPIRSDCNLKRHLYPSNVSFFVS